MTYKQAFDKITEAYIKDEIKPYDAQFCFCGTLCDNSYRWHRQTPIVHNDYGNYLGVDYVRMELALLDRTRANPNDPNYEDALFAGMCAALEVLKQIHIERGEVIDETPFVKRQLVCTN